MTINVNDKIFVQLGGGVCHSAVVVEMLEGYVSQVTTKAIKISVAIKNKNYDLWLPKSSLEEAKGKYSTWYILKKWFKPNSYQRWIFDNASNVSGQSCI